LKGRLSNNNEYNNEKKETYEISTLVNKLMVSSKR
jgi:hypothetical protein